MTLLVMLTNQTLTAANKPIYLILSFVDCDKEMLTSDSCCRQNYIHMHLNE